MIHLVFIAQMTGVISVFLLFCLIFWLAIAPKTTKRTLRVAILWTTIYFFFLFVLRLLSLLHIGTIDQLRIISGFTSIIPLVAVVVQLFLEKKLDEKTMV